MLMWVGVVVPDQEATMSVSCISRSLGFHWREVRMWKKVVGVAWEAGGARLHPPRPAFHLGSFLLYDPA